MLEWRIVPALSLSVVHVGYINIAAGSEGYLGVLSQVTNLHWGINSIRPPEFSANIFFIQILPNKTR